MSIPVLVKTLASRKLSRYCAGKAQEGRQGRYRLAYSFQGDSVLLFEERIDPDDETVWLDVPVARMLYDPESGAWSLLCADRNARWGLYPGIPPEKELSVLLRAIDEDPDGVFWG